MKKDDQFLLQISLSNDLGTNLFHLEILHIPDDLHLEVPLALDPVEPLVVLPYQDPRHGVGAHFPYVVISLRLVKCLIMGESPTGPNGLVMSCVGWV